MSEFEYDPDFDEVQVGVLIRNQWRVKEKLGSGNYGAVWKVVDEGKDGEKKEWALKLTEDPKQEIWALKMMAGCDYTPTLFRTFDHGKEKALVISLAGKDLETMRLGSPGGKFSPNTSMMVTYHMLQALRACHKNLVVHRDVKLANICARLEEPASQHPLMLVDFGVAETLDSRELKEDDRTLGKSDYCSLHMKTGACATRSCDLRMLLYAVMYSRGYNVIFEKDGKTPLELKKHLEQRPEDIINLPEDKWLVAFAKCIFSKQVDAIPDYDRLTDILRNNGTGFDPKNATLIRKAGEQVII